MTAMAFVHTDDTAYRVRCELFSDPRVEVESLEVGVDGSEVTLSGTTSSYASKLFAEEAVRRIHGVSDINNDILVVTPRLDFKPDSEIADAVRHTFRWNAILPARGLNCVVSDGWVLITGKVSAEYQKEEAEIAITHLAGVKGILNDVVVAE